MDPVRKRFDSSAFPFCLVYKDTKSSQSELPDHVHDWYELVYVYRGKGTFFIDQTFYDMGQGDLFVIPGNIIHRAFPDKEDPVTSTAIFFSPILVQPASLGDGFSYLHGFEHCKDRKSYKFEHTLPQQKTIDAGIELMQSELQTKSVGYRHAILLQLQQLLLLSIRELEPGFGQHADAPAFGPLWMKETLCYIEEHLSDDIGLAALSQLVSVTPAHFSRVFKQRIGMNVSEYITTKRIVRAKELLLATDDNISFIAELCGFDSLPHFHRMFKRMLGMTPAAYRRSTEPPPSATSRSFI
jgi:AraC-like DNA-binding protein